MHCPYVQVGETCVESAAGERGAHLNEEFERGNKNRDQITEHDEKGNGDGLQRKGKGTG
jgi:hypothetical protein